MRASDHSSSSSSSSGGVNAPRIASGNCSVALSSASAPHAAADVYEKQLAWKQHGRRKLERRSQELASREDLACTFTPRTNSTRRRGPLAADAKNTESPPPSPGSPCSDAPTSAASASPLPRSPNREFSVAVTPLHPTEAQESSIQLHLVRQERAREHAQDAHHKLYASGLREKDYTKVTEFEPFKLSVGNLKKRSNSASPPKTRATGAMSEAVQASKVSSGTASGSVSELPKERSKSTKRAMRAAATMPSLTAVPATTATAGPVSSHQQPQHHENQQSNHESREEAWERERASLVALLDTQRRELDLREKAQQDAMQVAANFAAAIQSFEERLVVVETTTAQELSSIRELLQRQAVATDLILQSLGITHLAPTRQPPPPPPPHS